MIYITGDTHGRFERFDGEAPFRRNGLTRRDYVIICGDFGGIWCDDSEQKQLLDQLEQLPFTILFTDGNHENYDLLDAYPVTEWNGGRVQLIRENLIHLMRGQIYEIDGKSFFTMGGAACHDLWNGVLDMDSPDFEREYYRLRRMGAFFRIKGVSWWEHELPTGEELEEGWQNLCKRGKRVDCVITHCAPESVQTALKAVTGDQSYPSNRLTEFLQRIWEECEFNAWYCGHYHQRLDIGKLHIRYHSVEEL